MLLSSFHHAKKRETEIPAITEDLGVSDTDDEIVESMGTPRFKAITKLKINEEFNNSSTIYDVDFHINNSQVSVGKITFKSVFIPHTCQIEVLYCLLFN